MNELFTGSICLSDMIEKAQASHSAFTKASNGKIYCNIAIWKNEQKDKYGNTISLQLQSVKDKRELEGKFYIGNAKSFEGQPPQPVEGNEPTLNADLSNVQSRGQTETTQAPIAEDQGDLPF